MLCGLLLPVPLSKRGGCDVSSAYLPYVDGDTLEQCRDLLRQGQRLEVLASRLRIAPEQLQALLGDQQQTRRIPDAVEVDLWADPQSVL